MRGGGLENAVSYERLTFGSSPNEGEAYRGLAWSDD